MTIRELKEILNMVENENMRVIVENAEDTVDLEDCFEGYSVGEEVFVIRG